MQIYLVLVFTIKLCTLDLFAVRVHLLGLQDIMMRVFLLVVSLSGIFLFAHSKKAKTTILISLDGVGWQFLGNNKTDTPNFDFMARTGVKAKNMITVNPTSTVPTHVTLVTGLYPESHGLVSNSFHDPGLDAEHYLEPDCSAFDPIFFQESEPIWSTMEKRGLKSGVFFWPTSTSYPHRPSFYEDHVCNINCSMYTPQELRDLRKTKTDHCRFDNVKHPFWERVETAVKWMKLENAPSLILLYFDYADGKGHRHGPHSLEYLKSIEYLDRYVLGYLIDRLRDSNFLDSTNIIVISDHSMAETSSERIIDLSEVIDTYMYDIKSPGIWPSGENTVDDVFNMLTKLNNSHIKFYKKENIPERLHWKHNRRIPPIYVDSELGWLFRKTRGSRQTPWTDGSHGWEPSQEMAAIFYARGPDFKKGFYEEKTLRAVDVYSLLCHLVGMESLPNNGSLSNMMNLLEEHDIETTASKPTSGMPTSASMTSITKTKINNYGVTIHCKRWLEHVVFAIAISVILVFN